MDGYLGKTPVIIADHPEYSKYSPSDWVMCFIEAYRVIPGDHHKAWVLDQMARILRGTPIVVEIAAWESGETEDRISTGEPSAEYLTWVESMKDGEDGPETYGHDEGIAP